MAEILFHVTDADRKNSILSRGIDTFCHWTSSLFMVEHRAELIGSRNGIPIVIAVPFSRFAETLFTSDWSGFDEPLTEVVKIF